MLAQKLAVCELGEDNKPHGKYQTVNTKNQNYIL